MGARLVEELQKLPGLRDVSSDQQDQGLASLLVIDRSTASRLGITPQLIVDTLYDAFGQRQVSTMFTQLNQYRVVLEVMPEFQQRPASAPVPGHPFVDRRPGAVERVYPIFRNHHAIGHQPPGAVPFGDALIQSGSGLFAR